MLKTIVSKFSASQQALLNKAIPNGELVATADLNVAGLAQPDFRAGRRCWGCFAYGGPVRLLAGRYAANGRGGDSADGSDPVFAILGLPLMNGYFTIFDGEADGGRGAIRFATKKG
jgi:hypothetical protein